MSDQLTTPLHTCQKSKTISSNIVLHSYISTATTASHAPSSLVNTIAAFATYGCPTRNALTIARTVAFAASVAPKTSSTVTTVACALIGRSTTTTIARTESTSQIVPSARNTYSRLVRRVMKCPAGMPFTGTVSDSWQLTIRDVPSAKRRPRRRNA